MTVSDNAAAVLQIMKLKNSYMELCDLGYPPKPLGAMFVEDGVWTSPSFGTYVGRAEIERFFCETSSSIVFAAHLALNLIIDVAADGQSATGRWRILMPFTRSEGQGRVARWILGDYAEQYVLRDGEWMFARVDFFVNFDVAHEGTWAGLELVRPPD
ncbi:nuclear transport factor 2 family protein [Rhizobium sp. KVB221]|uniref:Nuclear transport factor 2 family protein n=1 Tax=Rhizobium setariae TaxID=2801340 RepID=A0A937CP00_9HYPH|nr:nuclear transport factor 2 family protein [Rhizobium setariae]MBL0374346.1 nuclear transport factor 2 family protein [Rhizobium setariae]